MSTSRHSKMSLWSFPVDGGFIQELRDSQSRARRLRSLERERWLVLGLFLFGVVIQVVPYWNVKEWDSFGLLATCIIFSVWMQDNRCRSYIVALAELFDTEPEGTVTGEPEQGVTG